MDDKQIYTSARSEEIKRQIKSIWDKSKTALAERAKKQKAKRPVREQVPEAPFAGNAVPDKTKEKPQNIQVSLNNSDEPKSEKQPKKTKILERREAALDAREKVFSFLVYTLLAIIVLIIALGIFLPVFKK